MGRANPECRHVSRPADAVDAMARLWLRLMVCVGGLGLLGATLFPFAPGSPGPTLADWKAEVARRVEWRVPSSGGLTDLFGNMLLFAPFGFGLAGVRLAQGAGRVRATAGVALVAVVLSTGIEVVQLVIPSRDPAVADVLANTAGGLAGAAVCCIWGRAILSGLTRVLAGRGAHSLSPRRLAVAFAAYAALVAAGTLYFARTRPLAAWDADATLTVGAGAGDDQSWAGSVRDLLVADRSMTPRETDAVVRQLRSGGGAAPPCVIEFFPAAEPGFAAHAAGGAVSRGAKVGSQFTVSATLAAALPDQPGQFHIVSLAGGGDGDRRLNFSLLQQDAHLLVRLNSPMTGAAGERPQFLLPYLFADGRAHRVTVAFDGRRLRTFADGRPTGAVDLSAETLLAWRRLPFRPMYVVLGRTDARIWRLGYDAAAFAPLGLLAGLLASATRLSVRSRAIEASLAALGPPAALQLAVAGVAADRGGIDWSSVTSGALVAVGAACVAGLCGSCCRARPAAADSRRLPTQGAADGRHSPGDLALCRALGRGH